MLRLILIAQSDMTTSHESAQLVAGIPGIGRFTLGDKPVGTPFPLRRRRGESRSRRSDLRSVLGRCGWEFEPTPDDLGPGGSFTHLKSVQFTDGQTLNREDGVVFSEDVLSIMERSLQGRVGKNWERMADLGEVKVRELGTPAPAGGYGDPGW